MLNLIFHETSTTLTKHVLCVEIWFSEEDINGSIKTDNKRQIYIYCRAGHMLTCAAPVQASDTTDRECIRMSRNS